MNGEPIRLLNDSGIRGELRERLSREAAAKPQYDVDRGLARLRAAIAGGGGGPSSASEPPSAKLSVINYAVKGSVWRVAGVVGLAATAAVVGLRAWSPARHVGRTDAIDAAPAPVVAAMAPAAVEPKPTPAMLGADVVDPLDGVELSQLLPGTEAENLAQIEAALPKDPQRALHLANDGNRSFGEGALRERREASAIAALAALGRSSQARSRAQRFLKDFPRSPLSERVRQSAKL
jgi:hypothetical protein